jgi:hypothetical protein
MNGPHYTGKWRNLPVIPYHTLCSDYASYYHKLMMLWRVYYALSYYA